MRRKHSKHQRSSGEAARMFFPGETLGHGVPSACQVVQERKSGGADLTSSDDSLPDG
eukprot:CAMPEP_0113939532 /NCGR_PEP_ID=MMETSP1339-20121228/5825_1 /TAXON_ID=94617 /ORGANISM="Fibrocapsa japonica" /LENGTH=56 /DNA_ID=CAMNT_0000943055 /DNA_START=64 /DNA_END=234 /DNA_ORIENTATION=+ /assembly_acc=CAM_ASM_000762